MGAEDYKKEIVSMLEDVTDIRYLQFIYGATKSAYREEQAVKRIKDMERRGRCGMRYKHLILKWCLL